VDYKSMVEELMDFDYIKAQYSHAESLPPSNASLRSGMTDA
jgi:hypothetical protein